MKKSLLFVIAVVLWTGSPAQVYRAYLDEQGATKIVLMEGSHRFQRFMLWRCQRIVCPIGQDIQDN